MAEGFPDQSYDENDEFSIIDEQTLLEMNSSTEDMHTINKTPKRNQFEEEIMVTSQYAKVVFYDMSSTYLTDADIYCRYSLTSAVTPAHGDRISLFKVGWSTVQEELTFETAPMPSRPDKKYLHVVFKANTLPKDTSRYYQFCYINKDNNICGTSVSFQFRKPNETDLCEVDLPGGLTEIRSRGSFLENKVATLLQENDTSELINEQLKNQLIKSENDVNLMTKNYEIEKNKYENCLAEKMSLDKLLNEVNFESLSKDQKIQTLTNQLSEMNLQMNTLKQSKCTPNRKEKMLENELETLEQINKVLINDKKIAVNELHCQLLKTKNLEEQNNNLMCQIIDLEKQNKEIKDCNILLKREVESTRKRCEELKIKTISLEKNSSGSSHGSDSLFESVKARPQIEYHNVIQSQEKQLLDKDARLQGIEKNLEKLSLKFKENEEELNIYKEENNLLFNKNETLIKRINYLEEIECSHLKDSKDHELQPNISEEDKQLTHVSPTLDQIVSGLNSELIDLNGKLKNTTDKITEFHDKRVTESKLLRDILDQISSNLSEREDFEKTFHDHDRSLKLIRKELNQIQTKLNSNLSNSQEILEESKLMEKMQLLNNHEEALESISTNIVKNVQTESLLKQEEEILNESLNKISLEENQFKKQANDLASKLNSLLEKIQIIESLSEYRNVYLKIPDTGKIISSLTLRLQMATEENKKICTEKEKLAKRLEKLIKKKSTQSSTLDSVEDEAQASKTQNQVEIPNLMDAPILERISTSDSSNNKCPLCSKTFPSKPRDLFKHFESHLS